MLLDCSNVPRADWFPASQSPKKRGYYQVRESPELHHRSRGHLVGRPYRYWSGSQWWTTGMNDTWRVLSVFGTHPNHQWRGLARKP